MYMFKLGLHWSDSKNKVIHSNLQALNAKIMHMKVTETLIIKRNVRRFSVMNLCFASAFSWMFS